jgi:hypothetical protein
MPQTAITVAELARAIAKMRNAQRTYFRTRAQGDLNESKRLERMLDEIVVEILQQPTLFN